VDQRWTLFSSLWWLVVQFKYVGVPPALRYVWYLAWRALQMRAYEAHKAFVLWQCQLDASLAIRGSGGAVRAFSRTMALRRLHLRSSLLGELLYAANLALTGRVHLLPPPAGRWERPTFLWLF
jgi:hypothetical protein